MLSLLKPPNVVVAPQKWTISVKSLNDSTFELQVKSNDAIKIVKSMLHDKGAFPSVQEIRLIYRGKQLEDGRMLSDYAIHDGSTILLVPRQRGPLCVQNWVGRKLPKSVSLYFKKLSGQTFVLAAESSDIFEIVKSWIQAKKGIPGCWRRIICKVHQIDDSSDYFILDPSMIDLVPNPWGGGGGPLCVQNSEGRRVNISVNLYGTVRDLKFQILDQEGIHPDIQSLWFWDRELEDQNTLAHYGIREESNDTIDLVVLEEPNMILRAFQWAMDTIVETIDPSVLRTSSRREVERVHYRVQHDLPATRRSQPDSAPTARSLPPAPQVFVCNEGDCVSKSFPTQSTLE